jgi:hypothetical protein
MIPQTRIGSPEAVMKWRSFVVPLCGSLSMLLVSSLSVLGAQATGKRASDQPAARTRWMNVLQTGNYTRTDTQPSARPADKASPPQAQAIVENDFQNLDEGAAAGTMLGITVWRMRPPEAADEVKLQGRDKVVTPVRVSSDTPLREGDGVRLTIEAPRNGYLYVIDREQYADGSVGPPTLIFPTRQLFKGDNAVNERVVVEIPAIGNSPPFFTLTRSRPDHKAEMIIVLVSDEPLPGIPIGRNASPTPVQLKEEQVNEWTAKWAGRVNRFDLEAGEDLPMAKAQADLSNRKRALVHQDPKPQSVYWLPDADPGSPLMISIPLIMTDSGAE